MKKKKLSSLKLRKSKISNLNKLNEFVGGTDGETGSEAGLETMPTYCMTCHQDCLTVIDITACVTNDTRKTVQPPSLQAVCNGFDSLGC